jgi:aarF domain-containing kinase
MSKSARLNDLQGVSNGLVLVFRSFFNAQTKQVDHYVRSFVLPDVESFKLTVESKFSEQLTKSPSENLQQIGDKVNTLIKQTGILIQSDPFKIKNVFGGSTSRSYYTLALASLNNNQQPTTPLFHQNLKLYSTVNLVDDSKTASPPKSETKKPPTINVAKFRQELNKSSKESKVPSTRISRLINFGSLAAGLGAGAVNEVAKRALGQTKTTNGNSDALLDSSKSIFLTEENAQRIVDTLCKVRGAALKLGQMLSLQDETLLSPTLQKMFDRVRQSADFMPFTQTEQVLVSNWGQNYMQRFEFFDKTPFAAASIGQVHLAQLKGTDEKVAVKIQYPGVSQSIISDIDNLMSILGVAQLLPKGLYADNAIAVIKSELMDECDYVREAKCSIKFSELIRNDPVFIVPKVYTDLTTQNILVCELVDGEPFDKCIDLPQEQRNLIGYNILRLCLNELFVFRLMQTDPNWSNFFFNKNTNKIYLLDFSATREYSARFVDKYIRIIRSAADGDREGVVKWSRELKFLTGFETKMMEDAHADAVLTLGEAFAQQGPFDFGKQRTTKKINELVPIMLKHRLSPPPEESYSLHRY